LIQEESLWKHKSRDLWLTCKDLNTRFFHTSTLIRRRRNTIDLLKSSTDGWIADRRSIGDCFISNFKTLFASTNPTASIELLDLFHCSMSDEDNNMLCAIPTEAEIHTALASLGASKASGPDGFTALFYMKYWDSIKLTVLQAAWNFFRNNHMIKEQNHTFIALIPNKLGASSVHHFHPISLCNII
jgi:hypothetical protein